MDNSSWLVSRFYRAFVRYEREELFAGLNKDIFLSHSKFALLTFNFHLVFFLLLFICFRYGRLNVLRWLLWEGEGQGDNPNATPNSGALALHYAAAR